MLTGPSEVELPVRGLIDSGADMSVLPLGYAALLGYGSSDLSRSSAQQIAGRMDIWETANALSAALPGEREHPFSLGPVFINGALNVLWGRADFMRAWDVLVSEAQQEFTLIRR
jgi:hypothetical protein